MARLRGMDITTRTRRVERLTALLRRETTALRLALAGNDINGFAIQVPLHERTQPRLAVTNPGTFLRPDEGALTLQGVEPLQGVAEDVGHLFRVETERVRGK